MVAGSSGVVLFLKCRQRSLNLAAIEVLTFKQHNGSIWSETGSLTRDPDKTPASQ